MIVVPRLVRTLLALLAGAALGGLAGVLLSGHGGLAWVGAVLGVAWVVLVDALRGRRLVEWLRGAQESAAPRGSGLWGELGFRIERALRLREQQRVREELRLSQFLAAIEASPNGVLLLDAKYRLDAEGRGVPQDALADAYAYLGAIGCRGERATIGALLLYPGAGAAELYPSGVGALPLLPGRTSELETVLADLLDLPRS